LSEHELLFEPQEHDLVYDRKRRVVAEVMECGPTLVSLRPPSGGREWEVHRADIRRPSVAEELAAKASVANTSSRQR
jgi:hypothetical protein